MNVNIFKDKVVIVTGGNSGIGRAICLEFASHGAKVVLTARREKEGQEVLDEIRKMGGEGLFVKCDVSKSSDVENMVKQTISTFGKLDYAVNNAADGGVSKKVTDYPEDRFDSVIAVNLKGTWLCMKYEIPEMLKNGKGAIVNMSAGSGIIGYRMIGPYAASKHAVNGLTKTAALEFAKKNIRINALCPGGVDTWMLSGLFKATGDYDNARKQMEMQHPMNRIASPEEIAKSTLWLCSDESSFVTGAIIPIDGGLTAQ